MNCEHELCKEEARNIVEYRESGNETVNHLCPIHTTLVKLECISKWIVCKSEPIDKTIFTQEELNSRMRQVECAINSYQHCAKFLNKNNS